MSKHGYLIVVAIIAVAAAGCNTASNSTENATPAANSQNATAGTARQAPSETPTPEKKPDADQTKSVNVRFPTGATEASYTDSFAGYGTVDYKFDAKANQELTAEILTSDGNQAVLTVMRNGAPVESDASMVQGWTGILPANGSYVIRVGQMRNAARREEKPVKFSLRIQIVDYPRIAGGVMMASATM